VLIVPMPFGPFQPLKPAPGGPATIISWGRQQGLLASCYVRRTLYLGVTSNLYLPLERFTAAYGCKRLLYFEGYEDIRTAIAREKQLKGWRREKKLNLTGTINPEFKDLAWTWGWKMITVLEKMYPVTIRWVPRQLFSGFGGRKGPNSMGKISTLGALRLRATKRRVTR
jgi:putative endonuclease